MDLLFTHRNSCIYNQLPILLCNYDHEGHSTIRPPPPESENPAEMEILNFNIGNYP